MDEKQTTVDDSSSDSPAGSSRRRFLSMVTAGLGGAIGVVLAVPLLRAIFYPIGRKVVASGDAPIDAGAAAAVEAGAPPLRVELVADELRDAWGRANSTRLGAAWLTRAEDGSITAFSGICPHLGCSINFDQGRGEFLCPCHNSAFSAAGKKLHGPAKRGLDPLPVKVEKGRVLITWKRYKTDVAERTEA